MAAVVITTVVLSWYHGEQARLRATVVELDSSREQLAELFRQHSDAVLVIDAETRKVLQVNDTFTRLSGLRAEDMVGRTTSELNLWRNPADRERFYQLLLTDGRVRDFVAEFQSITGVRQWGSVSSGFVTIGGRRQLLTTARDITAEQAAAAAAAESAALVQAVVNSSDEIFSVVHPVTHRTLLYNQTTEDYFRTTYGLQMRIGVLPEDVLPAEVAAKWHQMYERALASGPFTIDYTTASGRVLLLSFNPVSHQGKVWGISTFGRDITDIRRAEQMQARLERELIEAQKMESLGSLAGGVAHDFNNMLDGIMGHAELMSATETDPAKRARLAAILSAATRSSELTRKLLAFARRGKNIVECVRVADLVADGLAMVQPTLAKNIDVRRDLRETWTVDGDPAQLNQVVVNLCINAGEAMSGGGVLTVATRDRVFDAEDAKHFGLVAGEYVELRVSDTGSGMSDELQRRIFEPFFTTKVEGRSSGTGLGLATVYGVVQLHRGAVHVQSAPGQGATFMVWLPKGVLPPKPAVPSASVVPGRGLVLIVDDEEMLRSLHADMVESLGYSALVAADGAEGVEVFRQQHRELAAVLLDLKMPVLDGGQAFLDMRAINPDVPVILCSGFGDNEEAQGLITQGARGLLAKPFRLVDLATQLERRSDVSR